jgi:hypothetical protein
MSGRGLRTAQLEQMSSLQSRGRPLQTADPAPCPAPRSPRPSSPRLLESGLTKAVGEMKARAEHPNNWILMTRQGDA